MVAGKLKAYVVMIVFFLCFVVNGCKVPSKFEKILAGGSLSTNRITESIVPSQFKNNMVFVKARINDSESITCLLIPEHL